MFNETLLVGIMKLRATRRKQSNAGDLIRDSCSDLITEDFKSKLNLMLGTPQGQEIQKRSWRVSDRFVGGKKVEDYRKEKRERRRRKESDESSSKSKASRSKTSKHRADKTQRRRRAAKHKEDQFEQFAMMAKSSKSKRSGGSKVTRSGRKY